jgi:hypothetical protein
MSVVFELVLAAKAEAKQIGSAAEFPSTTGRLPVIDVQGTDVAALSGLYAISLGREWQESDVDRFPILYQHTDEGPWIALVPDDFVAMLARANQTRRSELASDWAETEELAEWEPDDVAERVEEICRFAQQAQKTGKQMLLYARL